jgi:hypothetical protein
MSGCGQNEGACVAQRVTDVGSCGKREGKGWPRLVGANRCTATGQSLGMEDGGRVREAASGCRQNEGA